MAKKQQLPPGRNRSPSNNSKTPARAKAKTKNSPKSSAKSSKKNRSRITETANGDASSEDTEVSVVPSSSVESENDEVVDSSEAEDDGVEQRSSSDEEEEEEEEEEEKTPKSITRKGKRNDAKSKGKKRSRKGKDELKKESALYTFPMNRVSRIVRSVNPDVKIAQEAVFLINRASEKFLQVFCKEAYACAFLDKRKQIAYKHLSSVVSKRMRFQFVSDLVPEMVKAEDALAQVAEAEK